MTTPSTLILHASEVIATALGPEGSALAWIPASLTQKGVYSYSRMSEPDQSRFCAFMAEYSLRVLGLVDRGDFDITPWYQKLDFPPGLGATLLSRPRAKAKVVRPLVHDVLLREFGTQPRKHPVEPGMWIFEPSVDSRSSAIELRYNTRGGGIEIRPVTYAVAEPVFFADQLCCFGNGPWDMIFEGEEVEQISKIPRYIREAHEVCRRLRSIAKNA